MFSSEDEEEKNTRRIPSHVYVRIGLFSMLDDRKRRKLVSKVKSLAHKNVTDSLSKDLISLTFEVLLLFLSFILHKLFSDDSRNYSIIATFQEF